jgi:hypothetical protein
VDFFTPADIALGLISAIVIAILFRRHARRKRDEHESWVNAHSQVIGVIDRIKVHEGAENTSYTPVIVYTAAKGQRYEIDGESSGFPTPAVGSEVAIAYDEALPSTARLVDPPSWTGEMGTADVIGFFVLAGLISAASGFIRHMITAIGGALAR